MINPTFKELVERYLTLKGEINQIEGSFESVIRKVLRKCDELSDRYYEKYKQNTNAFLEWSSEGSFSSITEINSKWVYFKTYVRGWGGDSDYYPEGHIPTDLVEQFYLNPEFIDQYLEDLYKDTANKQEELIVKQKIAAENAERAKFEELKKKFQ
jgi:hypothetical protein